MQNIGSNRVQAAQLAQVRPSGISTTVVFTAVLATTITRVQLANSTGSAVNVSLYHDDDGTTFDKTTVIYPGVSVAANTMAAIEAQSIDSGITLAAGGSLGALTSTSDAVTITLYGVTRLGRL